MRSLGKRMMVSAAVLLCAGAASAEVHRVCNAGCPGGFDANGPTEHTTIEAAVTAAGDGDTILVWPGTYGDSAIVSKNDLTIRGMDRYGVLLDGDVDGDGSFSGNPGVALQAGNTAGTIAPKNVTFQNMSATGYSRQPFFWVNVDGYLGQYLTAFNNRVYGIYAFKSTGDPREHSAIRNSYAAVHNDGGFYIGECLPCNAIIEDSWSEGNALGYSGTNAGGNLFLQNSVWNNNLIGILPNTLESENDLPQRGATIRYNEVFDNNNANAPIGGATAIAPVGVGVMIAGGWANQIYGNRISDNGRYGVVLNWLVTPPQHNQVFSNELWNNGFDFEGGADLADAGPGSFYNCFSDNVQCPGGDCSNSAEPSSDPPMIQTLNSCRSQIDPVAVQVAQSPAAAAMLALAAAEGQIGFELGDQGERTGTMATPETPGLSELQQKAVMCMPNPCEGVPDNAWCSGGNPTVTIPKSDECQASL